MKLYPPDHLRTLLEDRNITKVAEATGLSYSTINTLVRGTQMNPTADTLQKLTDYFEAQQNGSTTQGN